MSVSSAHERRHVAQISDVTAARITDNFERPVQAGNAIATVCSSNPVKVLTGADHRIRIDGDGQRGYTHRTRRSG